MCGRFSLWLSLTELVDAFPDFTFPAEMPTRYNIAPTQYVAVVPNDGGEPGCVFSMGPGAVLGEVTEHRQPDDQRARRNGGGETGFPRGLSSPALPDPGRWLLRVAQGAGPPGQDAVVRPAGLWRAVRLRRAVGTLATRRYACALVHHHHDDAQRADRTHPQPDARDPSAGSLRPLAGPRRTEARRAERSAQALSRRPNDRLRRFKGGQ